MLKWALVKDGYVIQLFDTGASEPPQISDGELVLTRGMAVAPGYAYNEADYTFTPPKPYPSWALDPQLTWQPPTPKPGDNYVWDEPALQWVAVEPS